MTYAILLGNIISSFSSICLIFSCLAKEQKKAYCWQMGESFFLFLSSICFSSWSGATTMFISVIRNYLTIKNNFTVRWMCFFSLLSLFIGIHVNTKGMVGLIPILATIQLTYCNYRVKTLLGTKLSFLFNIILWVIYSYSIFDFVSGTTQAISGFFCVYSLFHEHAK